MCTASCPAAASPPDGERWVACRPGFFLPVRVLSRLFRRRFLEELAAGSSRRPAAVLRRVRRARRRAGLRPLARAAARSANGSSMPSARSPARRRCSPICRATPTGWRSPTSRLLALDERGVTFRWKDYRAKGKTRHKTMTLGADEFMRRFLLHVLPSGFHRIRHYGLLANAGRREQSRPRARTAARRSRRGSNRQPTAPVAIVAAHLRLPALRCRDDHRRDLRPRPTDPRATHVASCSMSTVIACVNGTSALRRPLADSGRLCLTRPEPRFSASASSPQSASDRSPSRIGAMATADPTAGRRHRVRPANPSNPHSGLASPNGIGACRGFLPCMLPQDRSFDVSCRCRGAICERLHSPTSLGAQSSSSSMKACRCLRLSPSPYSYPNPTSSHDARKGYDKRYFS